MKIALTEKQLKTIATKLTSETDVDEQNEPVSAEPKTGASDKQAGGEGYPEVTKWSDIVGSKVSRGPANQLGNTKWSEIVGTQVSRDAANQLKEHVFEGHVTTNGRYLIFQDRVFDIQEQKDLGDIWDSIDTFKTIFKNTNSEEEDYKEIQESILKLPLLESDTSLHALKQVILEFNLFKDTWVGRELANAGESMKEFALDSWEGMKKMGVNISQGEWYEVLRLLKKGVLFIVRKLKQALYSDVGMIVDAILVSTGIGKAAPFVAWALVVALDIYELSTGDYTPGREDDPTWMRYMELAFDIMGMVVAGAAAKSVRKLFSGLFNWVKKGGKTSQWFAKNPSGKQVIEKMIVATEKAPSYLKRAKDFLTRRFKDGANFISKIFGSMAKVLSNIKATLKAMIGSTATKGVAAGATATGMAYGMDKLLGTDKNQLQPAVTTQPVYNHNTMPDLTTFDFGDEL